MYNSTGRVVFLLSPFAIILKLSRCIRSSNSVKSFVNRRHCSEIDLSVALFTFYKLVKSMNFMITSLWRYRVSQKTWAFREQLFLLCKQRVQRHWIQIFVVELPPKSKPSKSILSVNFSQQLQLQIEPNSLFPLMAVSFS